MVFPRSWFPFIHDIKHDTKSPICYLKLSSPIEVTKILKHPSILACHNSHVSLTKQCITSSIFYIIIRDKWKEIQWKLVKKHLYASIGLINLYNILHSKAWVSSYESKYNRKVSYRSTLANAFFWRGLNHSFKHIKALTKNKNHKDDGIIVAHTSPFFLNTILFSKYIIIFQKDIFFP